MDVADVLLLFHFHLSDFRHPVFLKRKFILSRNITVIYEIDQYKKRLRKRKINFIQNEEKLLKYTTKNVSL